ncbi:MAG: hypothetical protein ACREDR_01695 [Blastocatellia bacterium]
MGPRTCSCARYPVLELNNASIYIYRATQASPSLIPALIEKLESVPGRRRWATQNILGEEMYEM